MRSVKSSLKKNPTRSLTFESNVLAEIDEAEPVGTTAVATAPVEEEEAVRPPPSSPPAVLMSTIQPALVSEEPPVPAPACDASQSEKTGSPTQPGTTPVNSPEGSPEPTVSSDDSRQSRNSRRSKYSVGSVVRSLETDRSGRDPLDLERTLTQQTLDSQVDHTAETLRARLGVRSGMVTGQILHDAAVALGLTRFSEEDVNMLVNRLAASWFWSVSYVSSPGKLFFYPYASMDVTEVLSNQLDMVGHFLVDHNLCNWIVNPGFPSPEICFIYHIIIYHNKAFRLPEDTQTHTHTYYIRN